MSVSPEPGPQPEGPPADAIAGDARAPADAAPTPPLCHGYAHGCRCPSCTARATVVFEHIAAGRAPYTRDGEVIPSPAKQKAAKQPWDPKPQSEEEE